MRGLFVFWLVIISVGCGKSNTPATPVTSKTIYAVAGGPGIVTSVTIEPDEPKPFRTLRREAYNRGLHWDIFCDSAGDEESYTGWAAREDSWTKHYAEEGAQPWWPLRDSYPSRELAAKHLLKLIQGPPTTPPPRKSDINKAKRRCLARIGTSSFYKSEKDCENCK